MNYTIIQFSVFDLFYMFDILAGKLYMYRTVVVWEIDDGIDSIFCER